MSTTTENLLKDAVAAERERCAKIADAAIQLATLTDRIGDVTGSIAAKIRSGE